MSKNEPKLRNIQSLHYFLDNLYYESHSPPLHLFITTSKVSVENLEYYALKNSRSSTVVKISENFYEIELYNKKRGGKGWLETKGNLWFFYIHSNEGSAVGDVVESWIRGMFPFIAFSRITPSGIFDILDVLNQAADNQLEIQDYFSRRYMGKNYWASQKDWERRIYNRHHLEKRLLDNKNIMDSVKINFKNSEESFTATIAKNGHITYYEGGKSGFSNFYRLLVESYIGKALDHIKSLENRQAQISKTANNKVFPIRFYPVGEETFTIDQFEKMIRAASDQSDYAVSVIHKGNPWLYLSIQDQSDGSSCDLYGFDERIEIVPLLKATPESLSRMEDLVYEVFTTVKKRD